VTAHHIEPLGGTNVAELLHELQWFENNVGREPPQLIEKSMQQAGSIGCRSDFKLLHWSSNAPLSVPSSGC
jgi:hypothetical protein